MTGGYAGKILRINLTRKSIGTIDTAQYEEYGWGYGIGSAIFGDLAGTPSRYGGTRRIRVQCPNSKAILHANIR
jgi:aldehyde:ferredoxin oxidoreductase